MKAATPAQTKDNKLLADQAYHALMADLARRRFRLPGGKHERGFRQQADWYRKHHTATHRGALQEERRIDLLIEHFGDLPLGEITPSRWAEYRAARLKDVSQNTIGNELTVMKLVMQSAVGDWIEFSPLAGVKRKKERLPAKRTITAKEEPKFLKALLAEDRELHDLYCVGVGTLLRQENLISLRRREHRDERLVLTTKTGPHQVPLTGPTFLQTRAAKVLTRRMPKTQIGLFFPEWHAHFQQFDDPAHARVQFLRIVRRAAAAAGIPWGIRNGGVVWHTATRASGATRMLREYQIDVRTVQLIGGWRSLDQMAEYLGLDLRLFTSPHTARRAKR